MNLSEHAGSGKRRSIAGVEPLRILCVHGVGHQEADPEFEETWNSAIRSGLDRWDPDGAVETQFVAYDELFAADPLDALDVAEAVLKLGASGVFHGLGDLFRRRRGFGEMAESVRWTAGMVVQWAENDELRREARQRVIDHTRRFQPHLILAHSLGSLLSYDAFARAEGRSLIRGKTFASFGSQIGHPFVRSTLGGRIEPLEALQWYHLFNPHDDAFTARLRIAAAHFEQVEAAFDIEGFLDHSAGNYLRHSNTVDVLWRGMAGRSGARGLGSGAGSRLVNRLAAKVRPAKLGKPARRALLVGINDYPKPSDRLDGCVNDVFLFSSLLQESGFRADDIRVVLNERATARGILDRLEWLLEGAKDGQERVFYYSGHGAQVPGYGVGEKVDRQDECLVTYDFDWSKERAVTDDQFHDLYSQLPYGTKFLAVFDCCHSGGMTREGGARARGLTPPDDIRHRALRWDAAHQMWVARDFKQTDVETGRIQSERAEAKQGRFGSDGSVSKLGVGAGLRIQEREFKAACKEFRHKGPYMPVLLQACGEKQLSFEYRHGAQSYGAFTYCLASILRSPVHKKRPPSWAQLVKLTGAKLAALDFDQKPTLVCPTSLKDQPIPWIGGR